MDSDLGRKVVVYHSGYGCDTGCCGHRIEITDRKSILSQRKQTERAFSFEHPDLSDDLEWAKKIVREEFGENHVADLDWKNCIIVGDDKC